MNRARCGFVTCVRLGLECMEEIYRVGGHLECALTLHDHLAPRKSGRVWLDQFCAHRGIDLLKIANINEPLAVDYVGRQALDWLFIIGWSQIARAPLLSAVRRGVLGMHPTLLPVGRGRAAIPWALLHRLPETGVTLFQLDEGVDTGPILAQERIPIESAESATTLYEKVTEAHARLIRRVWPSLLEGTLVPEPQDESRASVWPGRKPADGRIGPDMSVAQVEALVRAVTHPYPGAFFEGAGGIVRIWRGQIGDPERPAPPGTYRITLADGVYDAWEYDAESPSAG